MSLIILGNNSKVSEHFQLVCLWVWLLQSLPTSGEIHRRVYKLNTNNILQHDFSFRWLAFMSSTSKACFICGISGIKDLVNMGNTFWIQWKLFSFLVKSVHCLVPMMCVMCSIIKGSSCLYIKKILLNKSSQIKGFEMLVHFGIFIWQFDFCFHCKYMAEKLRNFVCFFVLFFHSAMNQISSASAHVLVTCWRRKNATMNRGKSVWSSLCVPSPMYSFVHRSPSSHFES